MYDLRLFISKKGRIKFVSHLDMFRMMQRAVRRAEIPLWYTEGFNPHPHLVFGLSLPLGVEALREPLDIRLNDDEYPIERVLQQLNEVMVPGMTFIDIKEPVYKPTEIFKGEYSVFIPCEGDAEELCNKIADAVKNKTITFEKKTKKKEDEK